MIRISTDSVRCNFSSMPLFERPWWWAKKAQSNKTAILKRDQIRHCTYNNSSPPSAAYMVQIMACRLFGAKPLSKPVLGYLIVIRTLRNKLQWNLKKLQNFSFTKMHPKTSSAKWRPFCPGGGWVGEVGGLVNNNSNSCKGVWLYLNKIVLPLWLKQLPGRANKNDDRWSAR